MGLSPPRNSNGDQIEFESGFQNVGRSYTAQPIFSTDEPSGSRFKMERFLHPGRQIVLSVYGPICFGPLPVLAFLRGPDGSLRLAASGALIASTPFITLRFPSYNGAEINTGLDTWGFPTIRTGHMSCL